MSIVFNEDVQIPKNQNIELYCAANDATGTSESDLVLTIMYKVITWA